VWQVLTHVKEKLQFVGSENTSVRQRLSRLDSELTGEREKLRRAKKERDRLRGDNVHLKQNQGFAASDLLVVDYEKRRVLVSGLRTELNGLKETFRQLSDQSKGLISAPNGEFQE
jgi:chromosome segregation ATPase